jgi:hypothetical protein
MGYVTVTQLKAHKLYQLVGENATNEHDGAIQQAIDAASAYIDRRLGYSFGTATAAAGARVLYGSGSDFLPLPGDYVAGSVTSVTSAYATPPTYVERNGYLVVDRGGVSGQGRYVGLYPAGTSGWLPGVAYTVNATYGYTVGAVPEDIKEACFELAVRIFRARDAGYSDVVGVDGAGGVGYNGAEPAFVKKILDSYSSSGGTNAQVIV